VANREKTKGQTTISRHTHKIKDQLTRTPLKTAVKIQLFDITWCEPYMSWRVDNKHNLFSEKEISDLLKMSTWFFGTKKKVFSYLMIHSELLIFWH
jgi:hypothetical protein